MFKVGASEVGAREVGAREVGAREVGAREVGAREVGERELGARDVRAFSFHVLRIARLDSLRIGFKCRGEFFIGHLYLFVLSVARCLPYLVATPRIRA